MAVKQTKDKRKKEKKRLFKKKIDKKPKVQNEGVAKEATPKPVIEMKTALKVCKAVTKEGTKIDIEEVDIIPINSSVEGMYMDLNIIVINQGLVAEPTHQYIIVREEGKEIEPGRVLVRKIMPGEVIKDMKYYELPKIFIHDIEATQEIITLNIPERLDDIKLAEGKEYVKVNLEKPLVKRIFSKGTITSTKNYLMMAENLLRI